MQEGFVCVYICIQRNIFVHERYFKKYIEGKKATQSLCLRAFCTFSLACHLPFNVMRSLPAILSLLSLQRFCSLWAAVIVISLWLLPQTANVSNICLHSRFCPSAEVLAFKLCAVSCSELYQPHEQVTFQNIKWEGTAMNVLSALTSQICLETVATICFKIILCVYGDNLPWLRV